ncbi:beta-ketoacyl-[acyl-carrier-protein] synthase family protein [Streptomyces radicis]|uniref:Beta-ketoacyl-[acyl-carrier-protein] synthase family protein n=1 Tax=Streptomyces radicis TaxID=1750517 RepID=A0A3A9WIR1_9ACTN|nr:beta-ketoacyl-[acyl-carrier-protein] synthase family protein [Streptomyces radicis]RKN12865.1 beta-ketoacyl-[acyl-carrier-protein] synthase family protein [Streptomyces radicis]RKN27370.1 beta-ketoacyl-[acyl-carrier-protein] synthase family protein [Streptomyces radicis]
MDRRDDSPARGRHVRGRPDVVVTGMGATTPLGGDVPTSWSALLAGESGVTELETPWAEQLPVRIAGTLCKDPAAIIDRVQRRRLDRSQETALVAAREAWADAGAPAVEPERLAVVVGTGIGGALTMLDQDDRLEAHGPRMLSPFTVPRLMPNAAAAVVSIELGARAGTHAPTSACASGAEALAVGAMLIRAGRADVVVAGGTDACLHPLSIGGFARMGALSTRNDAPEQASRPFDRDRDGFVMAEGAGVVVLERDDFARARGAREYAVLAGASVTSDATDMTTPDAEGQVRAIDQALADADLVPADISYVNAHATGTPAGDITEARALRRAMGNGPAVTATKASTGHLLGAAGAVEAIFTVLSLRDSLIPATRNLAEPAPEVELDLVTDRPRSASPAAALSTSFGFGGHNVVLVLRRSS